MGGHGVIEGRAWRGMGKGRLEKALDFPSGGFHEDVTDGQLGPRKELFGAEGAKAQFCWEAVGVGDFTPYGTKGSVQASGGASANGHI